MKDFHSLPPDLPIPVDDGAADGLRGQEIPSVTLASTLGRPIDLAESARGLLVLYVYPRTGKPGEPSPPGWDDIPGARGCTPQSCAFRDSSARFDALGASLLGMSAQTEADQREFAERESIHYPLLADPDLTLAEKLGLPTFEAGGQRLYRRLTLVARGGAVVKVFYPVFPPDRNAAEVLAWLEAQAA